MIRVSRRKLASYGADQIIAGRPTSAVAKELAAVLIDSNKAKDTQLLARDIAWELETRGKLAQANITTATELTESLKQDLTDFIKHTAKVDQVNIHQNIDDSVIGGVRIETAVHTWDKTIARQLTDIREAF